MCMYMCIYIYIYISFVLKITLKLCKCITRSWRKQTVLLHTWGWFLLCVFLLYVPSTQGLVKYRYKESTFSEWYHHTNLLSMSIFFPVVMMRYTNDLTLFSVSFVVICDCSLYDIKSYLTKQCLRSCNLVLQSPYVLLK